MDSHLIKKYGLFSLLVWFFITGCTQFSLNIEDYMKQVHDCQISVTDSRFDKRIFADALTVNPTPSVKKILYSKLCQTDEIQKVVKEGTELKVYISNIQCNVVKHFPYKYLPYLYGEMELIGGMTGSIQVRKPGEKGSHEYLITPSYIKVKKCTYARKEIYKEFIVSIIENFAIEIKKMVTKI